MIFKSPIGVDAAMQSQAVKSILPMTLDSRQYAALPAALKQRAVFASQVINAQILDQIKGLTMDSLSGNLDTATARLQLQKISQLLDPTGAGFDSARTDLILKTNLLTTEGYAMALRHNDTDRVAEFPAWELYRVEDKDQPRDWETIWPLACRAGNDVDAARVFDETGRMVALKDSAVWDHIGDGRSDALGNPYPPFFFNSGVYGIDEVDLDVTRELGLLEADETGTPRELPALNDGLESSYEFRDAAVREALLNTGLVKFEGNILVPS